MRERSSERGNRMSVNRGLKVQKSPQLQSLAINQQYSMLVRQLATLAYASSGMSERARCFETLQTLKDMRGCLRKELGYYDQIVDNVLSDFIVGKNLGNAGNLIGRFEEMNDEIQNCRAQLQAAKRATEGDVGKELEDEELRLTEELRKVSAHRNELESRREIIEGQLEIGESERLRVEELANVDERKLRKLEGKRTKMM